MPIPNPKTDAHRALQTEWRAHIERRVVATPPPPGRAACRASVLAAERAILGPPRAAIW